MGAIISRMAARRRQMDPTQLAVRQGRSALPSGTGEVRQGLKVDQFLLFFVIPTKSIVPVSDFARHRLFDHRLLFCIDPATRLIQLLGLRIALINLLKHPRDGHIWLHLALCQGCQLPCLLQYQRMIQKE